jgi:hypothetical protein
MEIDDADAEFRIDEVQNCAGRQTAGAIAFQRASFYLRFEAFGASCAG